MHEKGSWRGEVAVAVEVRGSGSNGMDAAPALVLVVAHAWRWQAYNERWEQQRTSYAAATATTAGTAAAKNYGRSCWSARSGSLTTEKGREGALSFCLGRTHAFSTPNTPLPHACQRPRGSQ